MPFPNLAGLEPAFTDEQAHLKVIEYWNSRIETGEERIPTAEGLANYMGITSKTIQKYKNDKVRFKHFGVSYAILLNSQVVELINGGLSNKMNSNIVKLMLHNHGYSDKSEVKSETKAEIKTELAVDDRITIILEEIRKLDK